MKSNWTKPVRRTAVAMLVGGFVALVPVLVFAACEQKKPDYSNAQVRCLNCKTGQYIHNGEGCSYTIESNHKAVFCNCGGNNTNCTEGGDTLVSVTLIHKSGTCVNGTCYLPKETGRTSGTKALAISFPCGGNPS